MDYTSKHKSYWCREYFGILKLAGFQTRRVYVFRRITWIDPTPAFVEQVLNRHKYKKEASYNPKTNRLYLHTQERVIQYYRQVERDTMRISRWTTFTVVGKWYVSYLKIKGKFYGQNLVDEP